MSGDRDLSLEDLYQEIILEHSRRPDHFGVLRDRTHHANGRNPLCGDEIAVSLRIEKGRVEEVCYQGQACAIAKASASIMGGTLQGCLVEEARAKAGRFLEAMRSDSSERAEDKTTEMAALIGVRRFPARVKCAVLGWQAFLAALDKRDSVSTEDVEAPA